MAPSQQLPTSCALYFLLHFSCEPLLQWTVLGGNRSIDDQSGQPPAERETMGLDILLGAGQSGRLVIFGGAGSRAGILN